MRLERHVGGLGRARQIHYLHERGWQEEASGWRCARRGTDAYKLSRALHHQLTEDLCAGLSAASGWRVVDYSDRGYARLRDPRTAEDCSLPEALRREARHQHRRVGELTYSLFLAAILDP